LRAKFWARTKRGLTEVVPMSGADIQAGAFTENNLWAIGQAFPY